MPGERAIGALVASALLLPASSLGQTRERGPFGETLRAEQVTPVVLSISGGISRGAYQAGVNWGLVELFKLSRSGSNRELWNLPRYDLVAMAGASAGGINGFLTALEWCGTAEPVPADASLFWRSWLPVGIDQLLPPEGAEQPADGETRPGRSSRASPDGVLSRVYFERELLPALRERMERSPTGPAECRIPVGVTVSRITPASVRIAPELDAITQRFASVVEVRRRGDVLAFSPFEAVAGDPARGRRLGELISLPDREGEIAHEDVFRLIQASSAFPGAFGPVELRFRVPCDGDRACTETASFSDGGLFDNNPIALAAGIHALRPEAVGAPSDSSARLVFIDSDRLRGRFRAAVEASRAEPPTGSYRGIAALLQLAAGAVPSARQYELTSFARLLEWAPEVFVRRNILATSRAFPILGDQVGGFGAFLGRPFREADFYVGVYDALHFFAREGCRGASALDTCVEARLGELVGADALSFTSGGGPAGRSVGTRAIRSLYRWEFDAPPTGAPVAFTFEEQGARGEEIPAAVFRASATLAAGFDDRDCEGNLIEVALCANGFRRMLEALASDATLDAIDASLDGRARGACAAENWLRTATTCEVDESFRAFVRGPERFLAETLEAMLHRLWRVERATGRSGDARAYAGIATLAELAFQSTLGFQYRRGLELNTSSVPRGSSGRILSSLWPNYASLNLGSVGFELGYRPTLHLSQRLALGFTATPFHLVNDPARDRTTYWAGGGPHLHVKIENVILSGLAVGVERLYRWGSPRPGESDKEFAFPVTLYVLADKIRLSARISPGNESDLYSGSDVGVSIGLADFNGLLYWGLRWVGWDPH